MIFNKLNPDNRSFAKYFFINQVCCRLIVGKTGFGPCKCKPKCPRIAKKSNTAGLVISRQSCNFVVTLGKRLLSSGTLWRIAGLSIWKEISIHDFVVYWTLTASQVACQPKTEYMHYLSVGIFIWSPEQVKASVAPSISRHYAPNAWGGNLTT